MFPQALSAGSPTVALLDVSVLVALSWPLHSLNAPALQWFAAHAASGWATCPLTEAGFVRVSAQPATGLANSVQHALQVLEKNCASPGHVFWPLDNPLGGILAEIRERLAGAQQLSDALLLDLAVRRGGKLVTLDQRIASLLPADSRHRDAIEIIAVE